MSELRIGPRSLRPALETALVFTLYRVGVAVSRLLPRLRRKPDLERLDCEVNLSDEQEQTYNRREHSSDKQATDIT